VNARFYAPAAGDGVGRLELPEEEATHLSRVLRLKSGDAVSVFNGAGDEFTAVVEEVGKARVTVQLQARLTPRAESPVALTLAQAVLKGDKMDDVVRDAVMMGVTIIQPLVTVRSEVTLATLAHGGRRERWQRVAIASAKQCGRAVVPAIAVPRGFDDEDAIAALPTPRFMLVEPGAYAAHAAVHALADGCPAAATVIVGPEGGWTPEEVERGLVRAHPLTLGHLTLRADAVPTVALTALLTHWRAL
jgi:16S rRNA (uracil1498-N3)-methyltransferase